MPVVTSKIVAVGDRFTVVNLEYSDFFFIPVCAFVEFLSLLEILRSQSRLSGHVKNMLLTIYFHLILLVFSSLHLSKLRAT